MTGHSTTAGVILAAGESRRMGRPKALLTYHGETFLHRLVRILAPRCSPVIVVLGAYEQQIRECAGPPGQCVTNPHYHAGQTSSLQCGLKAVPETAAAVLFTLVDHPAIAPETIDRLLEGGKDTAPLVRVPRYQGRRGHPVWIAHSLIPEFLALPPDGAARDVVRAHVLQTEFVDIDDPGIVTDVDTPEAYRELTGLPV